MFCKHLVSENVFENVSWARPLTWHLSQDTRPKRTEGETSQAQELSTPMPQPVQMMEIHHGL